MQFQYVGPRMKGVTSLFQEWSITPLSSNQYWQPNDVIKLMGNISQGLIDFYRSHIQFTIESQSPVGGIQFDNSAQSLISQTVILSKQVEIERIQQYDVLAAMLTDYGFSEYVCENRQGEGIGYTNQPTNPSMSFTDPTTGQHSFQYTNNAKAATIVETSMLGGYMGTICSQGPSWMCYNNDAVHGQMGQYDNTFTSDSCGGNYTSYQNWITFATDKTKQNFYTFTRGRALGIRNQYMSSLLNNPYPSAPWSIPPSAPRVLNQDWDYDSMLTKGFNPQHPYFVDVSLYENGTKYPYYPYYCRNTGYTKPLTAGYGTGGNEPIISATIPQVGMIQGRILQQCRPRPRKTFRMPLISAILGVLIPPDQFQLIPAASVRDIILQITLNPYAFFTTGYCDIHELDRVGMQYMQKRQWKILSFQWVWHLYNFSSSDLNAQITQKLYKGITLSTNFWQLAAQYQIPNGSYVRNSFQIPVNVESLAEVDIIFLSNEYQTKTFCRKQFRLSNNITSMQFKANGAWFPLQPIIGNAGNPEDDGTSGDNWDFYQPILLNQNYLFNTNVPLPRINQYNFAINGRIYDVNKTDTLLPPQLYDVPQSKFQEVQAALSSKLWDKVNTETAMGNSLFHENRYIGRAIFSYTWEPYGHSKGYIHGLNTTGYRQFDVIFNNSPTNIFPTDETMLIFARSNAIVQFFDGYIEVRGA